MFPEQVQLAEEGKWDEIESSDAGQKMIDRIISQPGEVKQEFEKFIQQEEDWRKRKQEEDEEASLDFIRKTFQEELEFYEERMRQEKEDEELAKQLANAEEENASSARRVFVPDEEDDERDLRAKRARSYREFFDDWHDTLFASMGSDPRSSTSIRVCTTLFIVTCAIIFPSEAVKASQKEDGKVTQHIFSH